ncbi:hypothetical protein B1218_38390, partial [Pseudomonas ogarae]
WGQGWNSALFYYAADALNGHRSDRAAPRLPRPLSLTTVRALHSQNHALLGLVRRLSLSPLFTLLCPPSAVLAPLFAPSLCDPLSLPAHILSDAQPVPDFRPSPLLLSSVSLSSASPLFFSV